MFVDDDGDFYFYKETDIFGHKLYKHLYFNYKRDIFIGEVVQSYDSPFNNIKILIIEDYE